MEQDTPRMAALAAVNRWSLHPDEAELAALLEEAWRTGTRNLAELAAVAGVGRGRIRRELTAAGVDWTDPDAPPAPLPELLDAPSAQRLARAARETLEPLVEGDPGPLTTIAWQLALAQERIAELLATPDADPDAAEDLTSRLRIGLHHAHRYQASRHTIRELALRNATNDAGVTQFQALAGRATVSLDGGSVLAVLEPDGGALVLSADNPLLDTTLEARDQLELHDALDTIAQVLSRHLERYRDPE